MIGDAVAGIDADPALEIPASSLRAIRQPSLTQRRDDLDTIARCNRRSLGVVVVSVSDYRS